MEEPYIDDFAYQQWDDGDYENEEYEDFDEPYTEDTYGANDYEDTEFPDEGLGDDDNLEEAYAAYLDARRHFAQMKAARGYFPVVALADSGSSMAAGSQSPKATKRPRKRTWEGEREAFLPTIQPSSEGIGCIEGQCNSMSTLWTSWSLGCQLHSLSNADEPYTIDYVITHEEGQDGLCDDGQRPGKTCSCWTPASEL